MTNVLDATSRTKATQRTGLKKNTESGLRNSPRMPTATANTKTVEKQNSGITTRTYNQTKSTHIYATNN